MIQVSILLMNYYSRNTDIVGYVYYSLQTIKNFCCFSDTLRVQTLSQMASRCDSSDRLALVTGEVGMIFHATRWCGTRPRRQQGWKLLQWLEVEVFSSIVGIVYLGLLVALFMIWLGSMHIRSFRFGFSLTRMFKSQSVGCDWFCDALVTESL